MSGKLRRDTLSIAEEAADWMIALQNDDAAIKASFVKWLRASPRHVEEFLLLTASDQAMAQLDAGHSMDLEAMIAQLAANIVPLESESRPPSSSTKPKQHPNRGWWIAGGFAAAASVIVSAGWLLSYFNTGETYTAATGEQRTVQLADGSLIHLNARSRIDVRFSEDQREVSLLEGEALFDVASDPIRPFRVETDRAVIRVLGTQFNVNRRAHDTKVSVIEGAIEVSTAAKAAPAQLLAGEEIRIESDGEATRSSGNTSDAIAWRQRRLIFSDSTLEEIVAEFNRYNRGREFVIEADILRGQRYGGTFKADEPVALIEYLRRTPGLTVIEEGNRWVIRAR